MAYDFVVGKSSKIKDNPIIVGSIDFEDLPSLGRLSKHIDSRFIDLVSNLFDDQHFSNEEISTALEQLLPLLDVRQNHHIEPPERQLLQKLISYLCFAHFYQQPLWTVAD